MSSNSSHLLERSRADDGLVMMRFFMAPMKPPTFTTSDDASDTVAAVRPELSICVVTSTPSIWIEAVALP